MSYEVLDLSLLKFLERIDDHTTTELIKQFKQLDLLPDVEKNSILKVVNALIRDFKTKQAYTL